MDDTVAPTSQIQITQGVLTKPYCFPKLNIKMLKVFTILISIFTVAISAHAQHSTPVDKDTVGAFGHYTPLDEIVVTALGIPQQKKHLGFAIQELQSHAVEEARETNILNSLAGKVSGLRITNTQGDMGSARIIIRGETSIAGNNQPLFVVDGIPVDNSQKGAGGSRDFRNTIADLNPGDVESISFLKGPNAAALYGSRAAHGVVLIKSKTGKNSSGMGLTLYSNIMASQIMTLPQYQNVFGQGADGKFRYVDGKGGGINDAVDESWGPKMEGQLIPQFFSKGIPAPFIAHPNNVRHFFRTGITHSHGIALTNAGSDDDYRIAFNTENQKGVIPNTEATKNNLAFTANYAIGPKLKVGVNANYIVNQASNLPGVGGKRATSTMLQFNYFGRQVNIKSLRNYMDEEGNGVNWNNSYYSNPYWVAYENTVGQRRNRLIGNLHLNYLILENLSVQFRTGTDFYNDRRKSRIAFGTNGIPFGAYEEHAFMFTESNSEATLRYKKNMPNRISVDLLAGTQIRTNILEENYQQAPRLAIAGVYTLANSRDPLVSSNFYSKARVYSHFGSAQMGYRDLFFINLTGRNDWSSTLPQQNLSYFYPSVNASFLVSELLPREWPQLNYLKLRGGWSKVGADADPYQLVNTYTFNPPFHGNPQLTTSGIDLNPDLKSETTLATELGLEAGWFQNRLRLDVSLYNTTSKNQILKVDVSPATGYFQKLLNAGEINNRGIEIQLGITALKKRGWRWDINSQFAANRSRVKSLDDEGRLQHYVLGAYKNLQIVAAVNQPYGSLFGNAFLRNENGDILVGNNGLPLADPNKKILGKFTPNWMGSFSHQLQFNNWQLSFLLDAHMGAQIYAGTNASGQYSGVLRSTLPGRDAQHGGLRYFYPNNNRSLPAQLGTSSPNQETIYEDGIIFKGVNPGGQPNQVILPASQYYKSTWNIDEAYVYDASFVKLREVKLGYTLPHSLLKKGGLSNITLSLTGRNVWILYKAVPNIDPEVAFNTGNAQGMEDLSLPSVRNIGFSITVKF